jgi:hypothetical protein
MGEPSAEMFHEGGVLGAALREPYRGLADRVNLYLPFVPGERDDFWRATAEVLALPWFARYDPLMNKQKQKA